MHLLPPRTALSLPGENNSTYPVPHKAIPHDDRGPSAPTQVSYSCLGTENTVSLVNQLVEHVSQDWVRGEWKCIRNKSEEDARRKALKILVYSVLLSHRKDYDQELSALRLTEVEEVMWQGFMLRQQRRHDDANSLDHCLTRLRDLGHLKLGSDVRSAMKFLVALKGLGKEMKKESSLAKITPRILQGEKDPHSFLPSGPLHYGDTFLQSAEYRPHYMYFPPALFSLPSLPHYEVGVGVGGYSQKNSVTPFEIEDMLALSKATPGTGINPLLVGVEGSVHSGKVMGALVQETREVTPDTVLSIPELPNHAQGYIRLTLPPSSSPSTHSPVASDEGYASSRAGQPHSPEEEDVWEAVVGGSPLLSRRTWESLGHIPSMCEKPFLSESGVDASHNVWVVYQELWGSLGGQRPPPLYVRSPQEICQDLLNLMIGVPSRSFLWDQESETFSIVGSLCHPGITPEHLRSSLLPFLECGSFVHRLEVLCSSPRYNTQEVLTQGVVFQAFTIAISNFLQAYRGWVFSLGGEEHLARLQQKAQPLVRKVRFVAHLCKLTPADSDKGPDRAGNTNQESRLSGKHGIPRGLNLLGELLHHMIVTRDQECLLILVSIFKNACIPFFRYLEDWMYRGVCQDPGQEFMVEVNGEALLRRDREYWTQGYTLRAHNTTHSTSTTPSSETSTSPSIQLLPLLKEVLKEAFTCGKALNLLRLCSKKHHLVRCGQWKHPRLDLCTSRTAVERVRAHCLAHAAHMDHLAALHQVTVQQKAEQDLKEKHQLMLLSSKKHTASIREIERKMAEVLGKEACQKRSRLKELKEEMLKAEQRNKDKKEKEVEEDRIIAKELEKTEAKREEEEKKLRTKMEEFYCQNLKIAERREALSHWRVQRCQLRDRRKWFMAHTSWSLLQEPKHLAVAEEEQLNREDKLEHKEAEENVIVDESAQLLKEGEEDAKTVEDITSPTALKDDGLQSPGSDILRVLRDSSSTAFSVHSQNTNTGSNMLKDCSPSDYLVVSYPGQTQRTVETKESPIQEVSSVSDMTASLMSTSSDFVDTPYDENLPDFDVDPRRPGSSENYIEDKISPAYTKSSIEFIMYDRSEDSYRYPTRHREQIPQLSSSALKEASVNKMRVLEEEYGIRSKTAEGAEGRVMRASEDNLNIEKRSVCESIQNKVLKEEYGITRSRKAVQSEQDDNANFAMIDVTDMHDHSNNGNGNSGNYHVPTKTNDNNGNVPSETSPTISEPTINLTSPKIIDSEDPNANIDTTSTHTRNTKTGVVENIGNPRTPNTNELVLQFKERRAQAAATRDKVMNEKFQVTTMNKNNMNILKSRPVPSSAAAKNKQKVLESEYGLAKGESCNRGVYSRQVSGGSSTSSYRSCSTTSVSTAFTTPDDDERPILIDQVGGEVLKVRGRSVHGHASDAVIHKLLCRNELVTSGSSSTSYNSISTAVTPDADVLLSATNHLSLSPASPYTTQHLMLMDMEPLVDITGTALSGQPHTRIYPQEDTPAVPSIRELSCIPTYFIQSIRAHLATQSRLVHQHLLSEVLVQESLLQHFSALRSLLLLHDAHFARALTVNLFTKMEGPQCPVSLLVPVELNNVLSRALSESSWSASPLADHLSFAVLSVPRAFAKPGSVLECLELRYHVGWPHTLILDDDALHAYSRAWGFLARLHHAVWASDTLFSHISALGRQDKDGSLIKSPQFHQVCLYRHQIHHFLLVIQAYVINQVHQISWIQFERKLQGKITSLDQLYDLHSSLVTSILSRCFLTPNGAVIQKLIQDVFSLAHHFRSLVLSHPWQPDSGNWQHPAFLALKASHLEFQKLATFLHKLLMKVGERVKMDPGHQDLLSRLDFNRYYSR